MPEWQRRNKTLRRKKSARPDRGRIEKDNGDCSPIPLQSGHRWHKRGRWRSLQILLSMRKMRYGVPLESRKKIFSSQNDQSGKIRRGSFRIRRHMAMCHLPQVCSAVPQRRRNNRRHEGYAQAVGARRCRSCEHPQSSECHDKLCQCR